MRRLAPAAFMVPARAAVAFVALFATALASEALVTPFSSSAPGAVLPRGWQPLHLGHVPAPELALVRDGDATVLRVRSRAAAGTASYALRSDPARDRWLAWRWKVDRVVDKADLERRSGDDFAARVYVLFDLPDAALPFAARMKLRLARMLRGSALPGATICYVWDNRHPVGTSAWSPYTDRVRTVVLESGASRAGRWVDEKRDLEADFHAAFGAGLPMPPVMGIAAGNDTDQTGETVTAWFGDFHLGATGPAS